MATVNSANAVNTQTINQQNPYLTMSQTSMANDFFGSQAFGTSPVFAQTQTGITQAQNAALPKSSGTLASAILQNYCAMQNSTPFAITQNVQNTGNYRTPTIQDYYMANQIASVFANSTPLINPNTSFFEKDMFAQQMITPANRANLRYSA